MARCCIYTIGHSTRSAVELIELLREASVDLLVDVRSIPRSRRNPQFNIDTLPRTLRPAGIGYLHVAELGGRRGKAPGGPSPNAGWREAAFRNYADYAQTAEFRAGLDRLLAEASTHTACIMCAEAVWWRCHRRIISDYLLACGVEVRHILGRDHIAPASLTPGAVERRDGTIAYPPEQQRLIQL
jgi:uncharacterized protein (DUF488 family)